MNPGNLSRIRTGDRENINTNTFAKILKAMPANARIFFIATYLSEYERLQARKPTGFDLRSAEGSDAEFEDIMNDQY